MANTTIDEDLPEVHWVTDEEARATFDRVARHYLTMSGEEFLQVRKEGQFAGRECERGVSRVLALLPLLEDC
ncbi:MAG: hypothetical protein JO307_09885 [Bryobacterales bacterium]|nr:hypothetical protein [Bryobacterales bacterium]MBV9400150.1 hypothetical protein [Bryobacterales bacterium]